MVFWSSLVQILKDLEIWEIVERNVQETATPYTKNLPCAQHIIKNKEKIKEGEEGVERREKRRKGGKERKKERGITKKSKETTLKYVIASYNSILKRLHMYL